MKQLYLHTLEDKKQQKEGQQLQREAAVGHQQQLLDKQTLHGTSATVQQQGQQQQGMLSQQQYCAGGISEAKGAHLHGLISHTVEAEADGAGAPVAASNKGINPVSPNGTGSRPASADDTARQLWKELMGRVDSAYSRS